LSPDELILFADIDGTLVRRSLEQWLIVYLRRENKLKRSKLIYNSFGHLIRWPLPRWFQWKLVYLQDQCESQVNTWIEACWDQFIQPALISESLDLLNQLRELGVRIVLLSGTPKPLALPLMQYLNLHEIICAEPVIFDRCYTGGLIRPHPRGLMKVKYVEEWLTAHGKNWNQTLAMADHWHDHHLLSRVAIPVAVWPKTKLKEWAVESRCPILEIGGDPNRVMVQIQTMIDGGSDK
jgi:phosphoserine phosphatase